MKKQAYIVAKTKTLAERFVDHLEGEVADLRSTVSFLTGKVERLELAIMEYKSEPAQAYVARTDNANRPKITEVPVEKRPLNRSDFAAVKRTWDGMTQEEQEKAVESGLEVLTP